VTDARRVADFHVLQNDLAQAGGRDGRPFIDYLRNGRGTTAVVTYSPRARRGFPIAAPISGQAVERSGRPDVSAMARPWLKSPPQMVEHQCDEQCVRNKPVSAVDRTRIEGDGKSHQPQLPTQMADVSTMTRRMHVHTNTGRTS
jgi:hypothetical protein